MSKASRIMAKPGLVEFEGNNNEKIKIKVYPLKNKELIEAAGLFDKEMPYKGTNYILYRTLIKDDPEVTKEDVENLPLSVVIELMKEISKVNKLPELDFQNTMKSEEPAENKILQKVSQVESLRQKVIDRNRM